MTKKEYKKMIVDSMKQKGINNECYDLAIEQLAQIQAMSYEAYEQTKAIPDVFIEHTDKDGNVKTVVNPAYIVFFDMQNCILEYLNALGLTPEVRRF